MSDLVWGYGCLVGLAVLLFALASRLGRVGPLPLAQAAGVATVLGQAASIALLTDNVRLATVLPVSNLIVVGNWTPLLTSFLAGLAWSLIGRPGQTQASVVAADAGADADRGGSDRRAARILLARRVVVVVLLEVVGWVAAVRPVWGTPPVCRNRWQGDFCWQTTDSSCSAACAATLLRAHGIAATEGELARLCLTRRGTLWQGLYRGLKLKTAGTPWDVAVVPASFDQLLAEPGPVLVAAGLPRNAQVARVYAERYGWAPGEWHSVLFFGASPGGRVAMGDPTPGIGREEWTVADLRTLWDGVGLRLVPRER